MQEQGERTRVTLSFSPSNEASFEASREFWKVSRLDRGRKWHTALPWRCSSAQVVLNEI